MSHFIVDTNAFLRLLLDDVPKQADKVEKLFKEAEVKKHKLTVPQIVIFELSYAFEKYYELTKEEIIEKVDTTLAMNYLTIQNRELFQEALEIFRNNNLSLADCFIYCFAQKRNAEIFTFDKALQKLT